jgi:hypothetical protein
MMSSIKGIRNLTGLFTELVPHRKLNGRRSSSIKYFANIKQY